MRIDDRPSVLTKDETQRVRQQLRAKDGPPAGMISRIGMVLSNPSRVAKDTKRHRFGMALLLLAIFQMVTVLALPDDNRRWLFFGFAWLTMLIGAWHVSQPKSR